MTKPDEPWRDEDEERDRKRENPGRIAELELCIKGLKQKLATLEGKLNLPPTAAEQEQELQRAFENSPVAVPSWYGDANASALQQVAGELLALVAQIQAEMLLAVPAMTFELSVTILPWLHQLARRAWELGATHEG